MKFFITILFVIAALLSNATNAEELINKLKAKLEKVNDYTADGKMKTNVLFIKAPIGKIKVYYKKPNKMRLVKEKGISILPKGGININGGFFSGLNNFQVLDAGEAEVNGIKTKVVKLLPTDDNNDVVITTLYIDENELLIKKSTTTTRENGSFELEMSYGNFANLGLPDKLIFSFNIKDYKMPKGVTLDFDTGLKPEEKAKLKSKKGKVEFTYTNYIINKGINDEIFK